MPLLREYTPPPATLAGRTLLITGAGGGLGRAVARAAAAHGATVILLGKTVKYLNQLYDEIVAAGGPEPTIYPLHLEGATVVDYEDLAERVLDAYGKLDGLLHNANLLGQLTPLAQYDPQLWARVLHVDLTAPFLLTQALLPALRKAPDAAVLFTSADVAHKPRAYWGAYAVAKAGLEGLMGTLAAEHANDSHIRFNSFAPGPVGSRTRALAYPASDPALLPTPESLLPYYLYLLGPESRGVTGQAFGPGD
jgi:NAD(P)-dependent dehydrogenase (short-subunit alcohol dehydrogenase family)